jgi:hypothetical protein
MSVIRSRRHLALLILVLGALTGCGPNQAHNNAGLKAAMDSVGFMLDVCSLFNDPEEHRMLEFDMKSKTVELSEMTGSPEAGEGRVFTSKHLRKTRGTFNVNEVARTVRVELGSQVSDYTAFMPGDQCILVRGPLRAANLAESWYAEADYSDSGSEQCSLPGFC